MRSIVLTIVSVICMIFIVLTMLTISGNVTRQNEFEESLATALNAAMDNVTFAGDATEENYMALIGNLQQDIIVQLNSEGDVEIKILEADLEKGLLDIEVTQTYQWAGKDKTVSARKTIILEEFSNSVNDESNVTAYFYKDEAKTILYQSQEISPGQMVKRPDDILEEGFKGWYLLTDPNKEIFAENEWGTFTITEDMYFIALIE